MGPPRARRQELAAQLGGQLLLLDLGGDLVCRQVGALLGDADRDRVRDQIATLALAG